MTEDPAQKQIQAPDSCRGEIKILDSCSRSQINLWSKSKIVESPRSRPRLKSKISNRLTQD
jgi:hypothetical protein